MLFQHPAWREVRGSKATLLRVGKRRNAGDIKRTRGQLIATRTGRARNQDVPGAARGFVEEAGVELTGVGGPAIEVTRCGRRSGLHVEIEVSRTVVDSIDGYAQFFATRMQEDRVGLLRVSRTEISRERADDDLRITDLRQNPATRLSDRSGVVLDPGVADSGNAGRAGKTVSRSTLDEHQAATASSIGEDRR